MSELIAIHKLSGQLGLTSRTLRHWESEGLFKSTRNIDSTWRYYDAEAVLGIRITALLRQFDIPIKDIKAVVDAMTFEAMLDTIKAKIYNLQKSRQENISMEKKLEQILLICQQQINHQITDESLSFTYESTYEMEEFSMTDTNKADSIIKFISLPSMRVVYNIAVSVSPEDEAIQPVIQWIKSANLIGTARLFGGNMKPLPSGAGKPYGYGMCASIPEGVAIPTHLKEMVLPGGLYAMLESSDDIGASWKKLMDALSINEKYESDRSRLCYEEHIRNDNPDGCGNEYFLNLLEPVKIK